MIKLIELRKFKDSLDIVWGTLGSDTTLLLGLGANQLTNLARNCWNRPRLNKIKFRCLVALCYKMLCIKIFIEILI